MGFSGPATGVSHLGPRGLKCQKESEMSARGLSAPGAQKVQNGVENKSKFDCFSTILILFRLRFGLFGPPGQRGPGHSFRTLFATLGRKGPNDPCSARRARDTPVNGQRALSEVPRKTELETANLSEP